MSTIRSTPPSAGAVTRTRRGSAPSAELRGDGRLRREAFRARALAQLQSRSAVALAHEVRYTPMGIWDDPRATLVYPQGLSGPDAATEHADKHAISLFFTKQKDWESEHEYRFVESSTDDKYTCVDIGETLAGVILGHKFPRCQDDAAFEMCAGMGAKPWIMCWARGIPSPSEPVVP
ncbi:MAG: hypothetical protein ACLP0J_00300 [Solirubrobacteraceae bacterium]